jgi:hypothetical protein
MHCRAVRISRGHLDRCIQCLADVDIHERLEEDIVGPMVMHKGRFRRARREHVVHGRQFFQIERDRAGDILGLRSGRRDAHREKLTDESAPCRSRARAARRP